MEIKEFIEKKQDNFYGFYGLHDSYIDVPPGHIYKLHKEDLVYNEPDRCILLNLGSYYDKKLSYLLNSVFVPIDELYFDLGRYIRENEIKLVVINNIENQSEDFYDTVYNFFDNIKLIPIYKGKWKEI